MSALRVSRPGEPVVFLPPDPSTDPLTPYRNTFDHPGGHKVQGRSGVPRIDAKSRAEANRRYRERKAATA